MRQLSRKTLVVRRLGLRRTLRCGVDRLWFTVLARYFKFDPWHAKAPFSCRPYKQTVVDLVNALSPSTVVELGCGLGEILCRVRVARRIGIDTDQGVIRAARFLHGKGVDFLHGDASLLTQDKIDCLIMVNWIHGLSPDELAAIILPRVSNIRFLVLDAIDAGAPDSYRYKHDFAFLGGFAERLAIRRLEGEARAFILYRLAA